MKLKDLCKFKTNFPEADFWITRKGDINSVGKPTKEFDPEKIGVKVVRTDLLLPDYLYYVFEFLVMNGSFAAMSSGTTKLKNITIDDIKNIKVG
jgi:restriction endonuclease S subunit